MWSKPSYSKTHVYFDSKKGDTTAVLNLLAANKRANLRSSALPMPHGRISYSTTEVNLLRRLIRFPYR